MGAKINQNLTIMSLLLHLIYHQSSYSHFRSDEYPESQNFRHFRGVYYGILIVLHFLISQKNIRNDVISFSQKIIKDRSNPFFVICNVN